MPSSHGRSDLDVPELDLRRGMSPSRQRSEMVQEGTPFHGLGVVVGFFSTLFTLFAFLYLHAFPFFLSRQVAVLPQISVTNNTTSSSSSSNQSIIGRVAA